MALIKCFECGNEISDTANTCPKCGVPLKSGNSSNNIKKRSAGSIVLMILTIIFLGAYSINAIYNTYYTIVNSSYYFSVDTFDLAGVLSCIDWVLYYIGTTLVFWFLFISNLSKSKIFKLLSGIILGIVVLSFVVYAAVVVFQGEYYSIGDFLEYLGNVIAYFLNYYGILIASYLLFVSKKR